MLTIRDEQMRALQAGVRVTLTPRVSAWLRREHPDAVAASGVDPLDPFVERAIERATELGISVEWDLARYAWIALRHGVDFGREHETARFYLSLAELPITERVNHIERALAGVATRSSTPPR